MGATWGIAPTTFWPWGRSPPGRPHGVGAYVKCKLGRTKAYFGRHFSSNGTWFFAAWYANYLKSSIFQYQLPLIDFCCRLRIKANKRKHANIDPISS